MHVVAWLATNGTAAIVMMPGALYRIGREQKIRKYLIENNFVDAVIQLPPNLLFGNTNPNCVLILKKKKTDRKILFIDAKNEFEQGNYKNRLNEQNMQKILNCYTNRISEDHFSRLVDLNEIKKNDYNISVKNYLEPNDSDIEIDFSELNANIEKSVARQSELRMQIKSMVSELEENNH